MMTVGYIAKEGGFGKRTGKGKVAGGCSAAEAGVDETVVVISGFKLRELDVFILGIEEQPGTANVRQQEVTALADKETATARSILRAVVEAEDSAWRLFAAVIPKGLDSVADGPLCPRIKVFIGCPRGPVLGEGSFIRCPVVGNTGGFDAGRGRQFQSLEWRIHDVTHEIAEGTGAKILP